MEENKQSSESRRPFLLDALVIVSLTLGVYFPTLRAGFTWDDRLWLWDSPVTMTPNAIHCFSLAEGIPDYLPLTSGAFWIQWRFWGSDPTGYHAVNIILHAANAVLVWILLKRLRIPGSWIAAVIFAVHPVNVASVGWISELKNTLSMLFFLGGLLLFLRFDELHDRRWYVLSLVTFLLGLLSKSAVVMFPMVLLGVMWWEHGKITLKHLARTVPFFALSLLFGLVTIWFHHNRAMAGHVDAAENLLERLIIAARAAWFYPYKALLPVNLSMIYPRWNPRLSGVPSFVPLVGLILAVGVMWRCRKRWARPFVLGFGYHWISLLPVLGFIDMTFMQHSFVADHFQYLAIIGIIAIPVGLAAAAVKKRPGALQQAGTAAAIVVVAVLSLASFRRASLYADELTLWNDTLEKNPLAWVAYNNRGLAYADKRKYKFAIRDYDHSIAINPRFPGVYNNRGIAYGLSREYDLAVRDFDKTVEMSPKRGMPYHNRAVICALKGDYHRAIRDFDKAIALDRKYAFGYRGGQLIYGRKDGRGAVIKLNPGYAGHYSDRGAEYVAKGEYDRAIRDLDRAIELNPDLAAAYNNRGAVHAHKNEYDLAVRDFDKAIALDPDNTNARNNRTAALARLRRTK